MGYRIDVHPAPTPNSFETGVPYVMAIRRDVLFQVGGFNPDLVGDFFLGDGATGLNRKLWERGMVVGYVPEAIIYHHIPPQKMTVKFFRRRMANEGAADVYMRFHNGKPWIADLFLKGKTDARSLRTQLHARKDTISTEICHPVNA